VSRPCRNSALCCRWEHGTYAWARIRCGRLLFNVHGPSHITFASACGPLAYRARRRGVLLLERSEVLNFGSQAQSALRQTRDVGSAFWTLLLTQTWLTVFTCVMTIVSIAFFSYGECSIVTCTWRLVSAP
jgi:hypothetical protein